MANVQAELWREVARRTLLSAERLRPDKDDRGCVNRAYYAAYQAATAICWEHGDDAQFAHGRNNPAHDQVPDLIRNNGDLPLSVRRKVSRHSNAMRAAREDADYRPGRTVNAEIAREQLQNATEVLKILGVI